MNILSKLTLESRKKQFGKLKTEYGINEMKNRNELIAFVTNPKQMDGVDIDEDEYGDLNGPPSLIACRMNDFELFQLLISLGAKEDVVYDGITLYDGICAWSSNIDFFKYLNEKGFDFKNETKWGTTPFLCVVNQLGYEDHKKNENEKNQFTKLLEIYSYLIGNGVDINDGGKGAPSPLMKASERNSIFLIKDLLQKGVDARKKYFLEEIEKEMNCLEYYRFRLKETDSVENMKVIELIS